MSGSRGPGGDSPRTDAAAVAASWTIDLDDIPDAVFATDLENRITHWADSAQRLFGYSAAEAIGHDFGELLPYRMRNAADETGFLTAIRAGKTWRGQGTVRCRDGTEIWIESTVKPTVVAGNVVGSVSVSRDVTPTIEAERHLVGEERFVNAILDVTASLVIVMDATGLVVRFNGACERLTGYLARDVVGRPIWNLLIPGDEVEDVLTAIADLQRGAFPNTHENHWIRRDGSRRLISWSNSCLLDERGVVTHVIASGIDITDERRGDDALHGIEVVGQLLAREGPTPAGLRATLAELQDRMAYGYLTVLIADGSRLRVGAQRGYPQLPEYFDVERGIVGRVFRTGEPAFVRNVLADGDYRSDMDDVRSEIAVPLRADGQTLGVLDIEATEERPLTDGDFRLAQAVAERVASAMLLGREQQALAERARFFAALTQFAAVVNAILEPQRLAEALVDAVGSVVPSDTVVITTLDRDTGLYRIRAVRGVSEEAIGSIIGPGDGNTGRAILERTMVSTDRHTRDRYATALRDRVRYDSIYGVAVPLVREGSVLGVISVGRAGTEAVFTAPEREAISLLGAQAALALANAYLHEEVSALAIHDGLTGLFNRRHFDASLDLIVARWRRERDARRPLTAIMFDLDHFGRFNKDHGHQAGDAVLRAFAGILRERLRSSDLVARFGGEEFVAVLEDCSRDGAFTLADEIRLALERQVIRGPGGEQLRARVSAGCAELEPGEPTKEALLRAADVALFMAKRGGRNQVVAA